MVTVESYNSFADAVQRQRDDDLPAEPVAITFVLKNGDLDEQVLNSAGISY
jgi:hypothetical protein